MAAAERMMSREGRREEGGGGDAVGSAAVVCPMPALLVYFQHSPYTQFGAASTRAAKALWLAKLQQAVAGQIAAGCGWPNCSRLWHVGCKDVTRWTAVISNLEPHKPIRLRVFALTQQGPGHKSQPTVPLPSPPLAPLNPKARMGKEQGTMVLRFERPQFLGGASLLWPPIVRQIDLGSVEVPSPSIVHRAYAMHACLFRMCPYVHA